MSSEGRAISAASYEGEAEHIRLSFNSKERDRTSSLGRDVEALRAASAKEGDDGVMDEEGAGMAAPLLGGPGKHSPPPVDSSGTAASTPGKAAPRGTCELWLRWATSWSEDGIGMYLGMLIFILTTVLAYHGVNINDAYATTSEWPVCGVALGAAIIYTAHFVLNKPQVMEPYSVVLLITVVARALGNYKVFAQLGLSASLWGILIGVCIRTSGVQLTKGVVSGEFFVKIGVCLMNMDFVSIVGIGAPGLVVAWLDTLLVLSTGTYIATKVFNFNLLDGIVVAGATSICGSSAATAISSSIHPAGFKDEVCKSIIAIMGVFNSPLMPLLPLAKTAFGANAAVVGAWIGGSVDSTGQVVASAEMGGTDVLKTAVIIKMAQNILIGPLCLGFTGYFQNSFQPAILLTRFPLFVVGFLLTSTVTTAILHNDQSNDANQESLTNLVIENSWCVAEYITLIGFACIGLEIDLRKFFGADSNQKRVLSLYLVVQSLDLLTTFAWSYLMFHDYKFSSDDEDS